MGLTDLIDPHHAVVGRLLTKANEGRTMDGGADELIAALCTELGGWRLIPRQGPAAYELAEQTRSGNCVDVATLFCAAMLRAGHRNCHVLLGSWLGAFPAAVHTWVLVRCSGGEKFLLIDPIGLKSQRCTPAEMESTLTITAIFDDAVVIVSRDVRDRFWRGLISESEERHVKHL